MPIRPFLAGQALEPDVIREMLLALETVCTTSKLGLTDDPNTRLVASKIIERAAWGARCTNSKHNDPERVQSLLIGDAWGSLIFQ
jgi:hypothetical protein